MAYRKWSLGCLSLLCQQLKLAFVATIDSKDALLAAVSLTKFKQRRVKEEARRDLIKFPSLTTAEEPAAYVTENRGNVFFQFCPCELIRYNELWTNTIQCTSRKTFQFLESCVHLKTQPSWWWTLPEPSPDALRNIFQVYIKWVVE